MSLNRYDQGQLVRVSVTFTDANSVLGDPTTVTVKWRAGGGVVTTVTPTKDSTGKYHYDIDTTGAFGAYRYRFSGTGTIIAAAQGEFYVTPSALD